MKVLRRALTALLGVGLTVGMIGLTAVSPADATPSTKVTWSNAKVIRWKDGDTVVTSRGTIRLIGVDTPETGRCGAATAIRWAKKWAPAGSTVKLGNPTSVKDNDRYGRSLRYVMRKNVDVSKSQIVKGAKARYDSTDGYQWHPRQAGYHKSDRAHKNYSCKTKKKSGSGHSAKPIGHNCPKSAPIKGNKPSHIYHMPGQRFYKITGPEICFSNGAAAKRAGYRKSKI